MQKAAAKKEKKRDEGRVAILRAEHPPAAGYENGPGACLLRWEAGLGAQETAPLASSPGVVSGWPCSPQRAAQVKFHEWVRCTVRPHAGENLG